MSGKISQDKVFTLFDQNMEENDGIYSFLIREKTIRSRSFRTLYCLFQIYLKNAGYKFSWDMDVDEKEKYIERGGKPKSFTLKYLGIQH